MGLDMYLKKRIYVGAEYEHNRVTGAIELKQGDKTVEVDVGKVSEIIERVGYWRKANQIHKWFVDNVQDGKDECQESHVEYKDLLKLKNICQRVIETKDPTELPPQKGFFFGATEVDDNYFLDLKETIEIVDALDPKGDYYYRASW